MPFSFAAAVVAVVKAFKSQLLPVFLAVSGGTAGAVEVDGVVQARRISCVVRYQTDGCEKTYLVRECN